MSAAWWTGRALWIAGEALTAGEAKASSAEVHFACEQALRDGPALRVLHGPVTVPAARYLFGT